MKLASIEKIHSIQPHPNTEVEKLEVGLVKAWPVVIPKNTYKDGDLVVFIVIDSIVPNKPEFAFMERQKFRVWNARFKGSPSAGLVMPLSTLNQFGEIKFDEMLNEFILICKECVIPKDTYESIQNTEQTKQ